MGLLASMGGKHDNRFCARQCIIYIAKGNNKRSTLNPVFNSSYFMSNQITRSDLFVTIGTTPGATVGGVTYVDTSLAGWVYSIERRGFGTMELGVDYSVQVTGGFTLLVGGDMMHLNEKFILHFADNIPPNLPNIPNNGISNGFNTNKVMNAFMGRIGWLQPTQTGLPTLDGYNLASTSGRYYNDDSFHSAIDIEKIYETQGDDQITDPNFNTLLRTLDKSTIMKSLNAIFNGKQLIEKTMIYERISNVRNIAIPNGKNFCGYRIKVAQGDYAAMINTVAMFFNGVATFNMYLFNDLQAAPMQTISVTTEANTQTIVPLNWQLNYVESTNKGGLFYIGYFQNDLPEDVQAMDEQLNMWAASKIFGAWPFQSPQIGTDINFNRINPSVVFRSYGLNLEISSFRDYTETIVQNANIFDNARGLVMAIVILNKIKNTLRTNKDQRQSSEQAKDIQLETDLAFPTKDFPLVAGLKQQLRIELGRINKNFFPDQEPQSIPIGGEFDVMAYSYDTFDIRNLPPREQFY